VVEAMLSKEELKPEDFVWKKGFENWKKIQDVPELQKASASATPAFVAPEIPPSPSRSPAVEVSLKDLSADAREIFIRIGNDRGGSATDYGPFSLKQLKQLFKENRINGRTMVYTQGMKEWKILADFSEYQEIFEELPPVIQESDRRTTLRKPFIARLFVQNNKNVFEGICRDISIGGMQVLTDHFKGDAGDRITINVHPENSDYHFTASGVVVRVLEGHSGFSFRFQSLSDEAKHSVEKYLQEISKINMINPEQEGNLARTIKASVP
jgi:hypothetical protein